jgi:alpha-galactosidase
MKKVALLGAGSLIFSTTLMNDMLSTPCLQDAEFVLMDPTAWKIEKAKKWADGVIERNNLGAKVTATTDRREALKNADFVMAMFQIGGMEAYKYDYEIPMKYGVDQ